MEVRKVLSYRTDFWIQFIGGFLTEFLVAYCVWKAVYVAAGAGGATETAVLIKGMPFDSMIFFYLLAPLLTNIIHGQEMHFISRDIYDGSLSRYLLYPVPFLRYKYLAHISNGLISALQGSLLIGAFVIFCGPPSAEPVTVWTLGAGILTSLAAGALYFVMAASIEMVAFWADNVWSLMVMLKFIIRLLGGGMLPLAIYPEWAQSILHFTPFYYLIHFPIQTALGHVGPGLWLQNITIIGLWTAVFAGVSVAIWRRGTKEFSGVGI